MKHREARLCGPEPSSGHFFCLLTTPLTLPSPLRGDGFREKRES
jgi:hypothetical protein